MKRIASPELVYVHSSQQVVQSNFLKSNSFCEKVIRPKKTVPFVLLIMNCHKYRYKAEQQHWLSSNLTSILYYHVLGNPSLSQNFQFDDEQHILHVRVEDDYNSLPKKVIRAYEAVHNQFHFQYIFKTDDDQDLIRPAFFDTLIKLLTTQNKQNTIKHYGGHIIDIQQNYLSQYHKIHPELPAYLPMLKCKYCTGRFYFLSVCAVELLLQRKNKRAIENHCIEDYIVGHCLTATANPQIVPLQINTHVIFKDIV